MPSIRPGHSSHLSLAIENATLDIKDYKNGVDRTQGGLIMASDTNRFEDARERVAQEERRRIRDENRKKDRQRKIAIRRQIIVGGIVAKHFPAVIKLQPQLNRADTDIEFAGLDDFVGAVAGDPKFSALFQELVSEKMVVAAAESNDANQDR